MVEIQLDRKRSDASGKGMVKGCDDATKHRQTLGRGGVGGGWQQCEQWHGPLAMGSGAAAHMGRAGG